MNNDPFLVFRILCIIGLVITLAGGAYLTKNYERFFGSDPNMPSENASARFYTKTEVFLVWISAVKLFGIAALIF